MNCVRAMRRGAALSYRPVTCIGSRALPSSEAPRLARLARELELAGYTIRSGAAAGADAAFERGLADPSRHEIYIPVRGFRGHSSTSYEIPREAFAIARRLHPAWHRCKPFARRCHARNVSQVLGPGLDAPSVCVVCWTPAGACVGGTAQALRVAASFGVRVFNLALEGVEGAARELLL